MNELCATTKYTTKKYRKKPRTDKVLKAMGLSEKDVKKKS